MMYILLFLMCVVAEADGQKRQGTSVAKATEDSLRSSTTVSIDDLRDEMRGYIFRNTELEDSLDLYNITPVKNVQKLLIRCWRRLEKDVKQKHSRLRYQFTLVNNLARLTARQIYIFENDDGIHLNRGYLDGLLYADSPAPLSSRDSSIIRECMHNDYWFHKFSHLYHYPEVGYMNYAGWFSHKDTHLQLTRLYDIDAYSLTNDSGEGIYRIDLVQKKVKTDGIETDRSNSVHLIRLDFDLNSLRLIHQKGGSVSPEGSGLMYYRHDYGVENGSPILTYFQLTTMRMPGYKVIQKTTVQLMEKE